MDQFFLAERDGWLYIRWVYGFSSPTLCEVLKSVPTLLTS
jgi:hypothetical protein